MNAVLFVPFFVLLLLALPVASIALTAIIGRMALASYQTRPVTTLLTWVAVFIVGLVCTAGTIYAAFEGY